MIDISNEGKFIDSVFQSIFTLLDKGDTFNPENIKRITLLGDEYQNLDKFNVVINFTKDNSRYQYRYNLYHYKGNGLLYRFFKKFKIMPYILDIAVLKNGFTQDTYTFKSNKENYDKYRELYESLKNSKPKSDKERYEKDLDKWSNFLINDAISVSRKRDLKLNKLIKEENK